MRARERWTDERTRLLWMSLERYWPTLERCAAGRNRKAPYRSTRNYNPQHHLIGVCGEFVFAMAAGVTMSFAVDDFKGDGAVDFTIKGVGIQVKAVPSTHRRLALVEFPNMSEMAPVYVLTAIDLIRRRGAVVGWERSAILACAPLYDFGYGERRVLWASELQPGLPPI